MTADNFDRIFQELQQQRPFRVYTVELHGGRRFEIDSPLALVVRDGVAVFVAPGGIPIVFDHDSINQVIVAPANTDLATPKGE
jgi:hypothetical protein